MLKFLELVTNEKNSIDDVVQGYFEICVLTDKELVQKLKNASVEDIQFIQEKLNINIDSIVASIMNNATNNGESVERNIGPMVGMLEAKFVADIRYDKAIMLFNEWFGLVQQITTEYAPLAAPKLEIAKGKIDQVKRYFDTKIV